MTFSFLLLKQQRQSLASRGNKQRLEMVLILMLRFMKELMDSSSLMACLNEDTYLMLVKSLLCSMPGRGSSADKTLQSCLYVLLTALPLICSILEVT